MNKIIGFWAVALALAGISFLGLSSCNVAESGDSFILRMQLNDSLTYERGLFDTVDIDLFDGSGTMTHENVFHDRYYARDSAKLANLAVKTKIPNPVTIRITAFKDSGEYWVFTIKLTDGIRVTLPPVHTDPNTPVIPNPSDTLAPTRIVITSPVMPTLYVGDPSILLSARAEPTTAIQTVTWSLASGDAAVLEPGDKLKALKAGTVTLKATSTRALSVSETMEITIKEAATELPKSVVISNVPPLLLTVDGPSVALVASVLPVGAKQDIKWTMPSNTVAILEPGNLVKGLKAGTVTLTASSAIVPSVFDTLVVTVQAPPAVLPELITLKTPTLNLLVGAPPVTLEATVSPPAASPNVIWTFDAPGVVEIVNNNQIKGLKNGTAKVTATSAVKSSVTATIDVTVETAVVVPESISLRMPTPMVLAVGGTDGDLLWTVLPTGSDNGVEWTSSDSTIAKIIEGNKVRPLKKGPAKITGKSKVKPTITATFDVSVIVPVKVDAINILPKTLTLYTGGPQGTLAVTLTGNDTGAQFTLSSSDAIIATVSAAGAVKGLAAGSAVITAAVVGYPAVTSVCSVKVVKDPPVVTVTPNQNVAFNGEAVFTVSVAPQAYGTTVEIKADMDGDNVYEQTVLNKETADFKQKYTEVKSTTVSFKVKDTEGNEETVTRKVTVGAPGAPIVSIVNPSKDTTINVLSLKIRFTVKDTALKIDTFVDSTVALIAGSNKVRAARTNAGGEGSDEVTVLVDNTPPTVAITGAATQTTGVAAFSLAGTASDLGSGLQSVNITGALTGNGLATLTVGDWSKGGLTLAEGANTLVATALDKAGNTKTASITVTLDSKKPGAPVVTAPAAVRAGPIKWTWVKANADGSGKFKVKINGGAEIDAALAEYTLAATGMTDGTVYGLSVKETDPVAGDGPWSAEKKVLFDSKKPNPSISGTLGVTRTPEWKWSSNGGVGTFRWFYKATPGTFLGNNSPSLLYKPAIADGIEASYELCVQEKDSPEWVDEWGTANCAIINVDTKAPEITNIKIPDGFVTNKSPLNIGFSVGTTPDPKGYDCSLALNNSANNCTITASDPAGNTASVTRKVWLRNNVVFVRKGFTGSGSSFDDAFGSLRQALSVLASGQNQIWIMEGTYAMTGTPGPFVPSGVSIYGGFSEARNQGSVTDRNSSANRTVLSSKWEVGDDFSREILNIKLDNGSPVQNILLDGMTMSAGYYGLNIQNASAITLSKILFTNSTAAPIVGISTSTVTLNDCEFIKNSGGILQVSGNTVTLNRCKFSDNDSPPSAFDLYEGKVIVNNSTFQNSSDFSGFQYWVMVAGGDASTTLEMYNNTIQGWGANIDPGTIVTFNGETAVKYFFIGSGNHQ